MNKNYLKERKEKIEKEKIIKEKKELLETMKINILKSSINFHKYGWVSKVSKIIGITSQNVNKWMRKNVLKENNNINKKEP